MSLEEDVGKAGYLEAETQSENESGPGKEAGGSTATSPKKQRPGGQGGEVLIHLEKYGKSWSGAWWQRASQTTAKWSEFKLHQQEDKGMTPERKSAL